MSFFLSNIFLLTESNKKLSIPKYKHKSVLLYIYKIIYYISKNKNKNGKIVKVVCKKLCGIKFPNLYNDTHLSISIK